MKQNKQTLIGTPQKLLVEDVAIPGAQIGAPKDGPKDLLRVEAPPPLRRGVIPLLFIGLLLFGVLLVAGLGFHWYYTGSKPVQPIAFSHNLHLEKVGLGCDHCHTYADKSPQAGIPAMQICMECHQDVAIDRPEVKKLKSYWDRKEPIPWLKVHVQPWHVRFIHKRHIKAKIQCTYCHGEIKAMTTVRKVRSLEMGWCVTCHRENKAPTDCLTCHK